MKQKSRHTKYEVMMCLIKKKVFHEVSFEVLTTTYQAACDKTIISKHSIFTSLFLTITSNGTNGHDYDIHGNIHKIICKEFLTLSPLPDLAHRQHQ